MREKFAGLPAALQKQTGIRIGLGLVFLFLFLMILIVYRDFCFGLPCLLSAAFLLGNGGWLLRQGIHENYIRVEGVCDLIEKTGVRKRIRSIRIQLDQNTLQIPIRQGLKQLAVGDTVAVYLSDRTPVYEHDGGYMICGYLALETGKRCGQNEGK